VYATVEDVEKRCGCSLSLDEIDWCRSLLEDAAVIVDTYGRNASDDAKKVVSCNMVVRMIRNNTDQDVPIGASQGTISALGYSQTWSLGSGSAGELYLTKLDKKILGCGNRIAFSGPFVED
jgi:hypothetical protein